MNLWAEDLPDKCLVVLAGRDELLHADEVGRGCGGAPWRAWRRWHAHKAEVNGQG